MKIGDLIWQHRFPGGLCIFLGDVHGDPEHLLKILHPTEGYLEDPSYYYISLDELEKLGGRHDVDRGR